MLQKIKQSIFDWTQLQKDGEEKNNLFKIEIGRNLFHFNSTHGFDIFVKWENAFNYWFYSHYPSGFVDVDFNSPFLGEFEVRFSAREYVSAYKKPRTRPVDMGAEDLPSLVSLEQPERLHPEVERMQRMMLENQLRNDAALNQMRRELDKKLYGDASAPPPVGEGASGNNITDVESDNIATEQEKVKESDKKTE